MQFSSSFFEDEVREGFYVPGIMKRAWAAQLEVLEEVAKVCEKHNIRWFADCGTLLGAVRHGGYIPWDDDLDICMLRDDYIRFNKIAKQELPKEYCVINFHNEEDYWELLTRVTNGRSIRMDAEHLKKYHDFPYVAGIDIFPLDYVAPKKADEDLRKQIAAIVSGVATSINEENQNTPQMQELVSQVEKMCGVKLDRKSPLKIQLFSLLENLFSLYSAKEAKEVVLMPYWIDKGDHKYPIEFFEKIIQIPFEGFGINVPAAYEGVLRIEYLDYMKCVRSGGVHDYPFYKKQEAQLMRALGEKAHFKYVFSENDLKNEERFMRVKSKELVENFTQSMDKVHKEICCAIHEKDNLSAMELLEVCQSEAIDAGTAIEQIEGEGFATVCVLEEYCELVYQIHEELGQNNNINEQDCAERLKEILMRVTDSIKNSNKIHKEIVFLPYKASMWDSLESVWKAAVEDKDCDVYVIPIPYYDKNADGSFREMHYEGDQFPAYVPIVDFNEYDFERRHPDMIFIHNPYDEYNRVTSVHPYFYSKAIKKYTDMLVYIPYFVLDEINPEDQRAVQSMEHFVTVPGVIHADRVIVQSDKMRDAYIDTLSEFAGEHTRKTWEEKILGLGSPKYDKVVGTKKEELEMPEQWRKLLKKEDGSIKKIIFYNTSVSALLEHGEKMIDKMQNLFQVFKDNQNEVVLLWRPHPLIKATIASMRPQLWDKYQELVEQYVKEGWGIYDDSADIDRAIAISDAYYGDPSSVVQLYKTTGKPIMIQNINL